MRIFFNPTRRFALFRFRVTVTTSRDPLFLDISPQNIQSLYLRPGPPRCLHFQFNNVTLIGPKDILLRSSDCPNLTALQSFAQRKAMRVSLIETAIGLPQLTALCEAVNRGGLRRDPQQMDLQSLYRGQGGRIISVDDLSASASLPDQPPADLFSTLHAVEDNLPMYLDLAPPHPPPPVSPGPSKRARRASSSPPPTYDTYKHFDLACGEREKMMAELLRRAADKEKRLQYLIDEVEAKETRLDNLIARLTAVIATAEGAVRKVEHSPPLVQAEQQIQQAASPSKETTISASPSASTAASTSSYLSERIQTYIATQLDQLRGELVDKYATQETVDEVHYILADEYVTFDAVEQRVTDEVERVLNRYVEEPQMFEAIREATDQAVEEVRSRILAAWE